jgi:hypothetical protein
MWAVLMEVILKAHGFWEAEDQGCTEQLENRMAMEAHPLIAPARRVPIS